MPNEETARVLKRAALESWEEELIRLLPVEMKPQCNGAFSLSQI
jgi:hypothetical protein